MSSSERLSDSDIQQLSEDWRVRLEQELAVASFTSKEFTDLADQHRRLARVTDSAGQRRALVRLADRLEREAHDRAAVGR